MKKTRVLLVWLYTRADLMKPFLSLSGRMEITALFFNSKEEEGPLTDAHLYSRIYWSDFRTPAAILNASKPEIIIFMGFASLKGIALRVAAAQRDIPCFMIEHGIKNDLKWISSDHEANAGNKITFLAKNIFAKGLSLFATLFFAYSTIRWKNRHLAWTFTRMAYAFVKHPPQIALARVRFIERVADKYFIFGPFMIQSFLEQSDIPPERFKVIGSIFYDDFFNQYHQAAAMPAVIQDKYILFIDQPVEGFIGGFTMENKRRLFEELSAKAAVSGYRLVIKLHPNDYHNEALNIQMERNPQITWVKAGDVPNLIYNSSACFGFFSTLLMPVICFKPCFVFDIFNIPFIKQWADMGVIFRLESNDISGIDFGNFGKYQVSEADRQHFIDTYLFKTDGKALERLENEILK